ncbi:MAG: hypothetical protein Q8O52_03375 [Sulfuritalea sp.]|nr:hypothetical protein [Sulfuritalea sp.]
MIGEVYIAGRIGVKSGLESRRWRDGGIAPGHDPVGVDMGVL